MTPMSQPQIAPVHHDDHGSTPAAWTAVAIITLAFVVGTVAVILGNWTMFWAAAAMVVVGAIVGKVMAMMGMGKART